VNPFLRRIRVPFSRAMAYTGAATGKQDNYGDQQIRGFTQGIQLISACFHVAIL
jgi:hypothetical protein